MFPQKISESKKKLAESLIGIILLTRVLRGFVIRIRAEGKSAFNDPFCIVAVGVLFLLAYIGLITACLVVKI